MWYVHHTDALGSFVDVKTNEEYLSFVRCFFLWSLSGESFWAIYCPEE